MSSTVKIKVLRDIGRHRKGATVTVEVDRNGTIIDRFWRRRVRDSERDNCCEVVKTQKSKPREKSNADDRS